MTASAKERDLAFPHAKERSDAAFEALVARHVDLVFGTAMRHVGDRALAEEITQNVFVILARKAPTPRGQESLAGWLHRATVLESRAHVRKELRRRHREHDAAEFAALRNEGASPFESLVPLLDEGLMRLRDKDRLALISRFIEERSLREVGSLLGIDEDTARKRVSRALDRLASFFRKRGFAVPGTAGIAALFGHANEATPAGLALFSARAALSISAPPFHLSLLQIMTFSKTNTAIICALLVSVPLLWNRSAQAKMEQREQSLQTELSTERENLQNLASEKGQLEGLLRLEAANRQNTRQAAVQKHVYTASADARYHWEDGLPLMRVPKALLKSAHINAVLNRTGVLNPTIKEALQMTENEAAGAQVALQKFLGDVQAAQRELSKVVEPSVAELNGRPSSEVRVFEVGDAREQIREYRSTLYTTLDTLLGPDRSELFRQGLRGWMQDEDKNGITSTMAVFEGAHRITFQQPNPGQDFLGWGVSQKGSSMTTTINFDEIPPAFLPRLQDWMELAKSRPLPERPESVKK